jgi:hypothetical protein
LGKARLRFGLAVRDTSLVLSSICVLTICTFSDINIRFLHHALESQFPFPFSAEVCVCVCVCVCVFIRGNSDATQLNSNKIASALYMLSKRVNLECDTRHDTDCAIYPGCMFMVGMHVFTRDVKGQP